jgi:predicted MPP superfamily phosphohydrolase
MRVSRRALLKTAAIAGVGAGTGAASYGALFERHALELTSAELPVSGLPPALDGLRIAFLTDLHHGLFVPPTDIERAVALALRTAPDLIVLGGDYVTSADRTFMEPVAELLSGLHAPHGVFAVLGNHDDDREMPAALSRHRVSVLRDQRTALTVRGERLDLAGVRYWTRRPADIARILKGAGDTVLLLAHDPRRLIEAAAYDVGGVLAGHTHGGQIVLPGVGALAARKFPVPFGLASRGNTSMFVSRGIGTVMIPVRLNCPPEVALVTLRRRADF